MSFSLGRDTPFSGSQCDRIPQRSQSTLTLCGFVFAGTSHLTEHTHICILLHNGECISCTLLQKRTATALKQNSSTIHFQAFKTNLTMLWITDGQSYLSQGVTYVIHLSRSVLVKIAAGPGVLESLALLKQSFMHRPQRGMHCVGARGQTISFEVT